MKDKETHLRCWQALLLLLAMGNTHSHPPPGKISATYAEALMNVQQLKADYGNGVSTKIIFFNDSPEDLIFGDSDHSSGRWQNEPPARIPAGKFASFLHVKRDAAACGSVGYASYKQVMSGDNIFIGWSTPHSGTNMIGVDVFPHGSFPEKPFEITGQTKHKRSSDPEGVAIRGEGTLQEDHASVLVYFICSPSLKQQQKLTCNEQQQP